MKAKAKRADSGEWVEGYYYKSIVLGHFIINKSHRDIQIDPSTLVFPEMEELKKENYKLKDDVGDLSSVNLLIDQKIKGLEKQNTELLEALKEALIRIKNESRMYMYEDEKEFLNECQQLIQKAE